MAISKALILQGILGVAGLCASSAGGVGLGLEKAFLGVKGDQDSEDDSSLEPKAAEIIEVVKEEDELGIPRECDSSCSLSVEQLKKLKFEVKDNEEIKFEGLNDSDEFELLIEVTEDLINYPKGKKYTLKPKTIGGTVTIKNIKEENIVLEGSREILIRETIWGGKLEHLLEEVDGLGIPKRCKGEQAARTCDLTQQQLEKLKFEAKDGEKISVEGLGEGNIVTLKIEDKGSDGNNYPRGKKYTLRSASGTVTIGGVKDGDITLGAEEVLIREIKGGGRLEHLIEEVDRLGIPKRCNADGVKGEPKTCELKQKQLRDLRFEPKEGTSILVEEQSEDSTFELIIEDKPNDRDDYPKGKKYTLRSKTGKVTIKNVEEGDITLLGGLSVVIREAEGGDKFEMAPEEVDELGIPESCNSKKICNITAEQIKKLHFEKGEDSSIEVKNLPKGKTVTLKVEDKPNDEENYPKGKKYTLSAKYGQQVTIKGFSGGDITIEKGGVVIREKGDVKKLEIAPEEIDRLGIPRRCESGSTCDLTKGQLEKFKFETNSGSSVSVEGLEGNNAVELRVETPSDLTDYPKGKKYTLTAKSGTVTIQNVKGGNIEIGTEEGFVIREKIGGGKLEKVPKEFNELGIPRWCKEDEVKSGSNPKTCEFTQKQLKGLKFKVFEDGSDEVKVDGLSGNIKLTISWSEDKNTYPDNKKYSFDNTKGEKDITITKGGQTVTIAKQKETRFKNVEDKLEWVEAKDKSQIARENKLAEVEEILKKLGLGGLSTSISFTGDDANNPTRHGETKVADFSKESDLKKIQFKEFMGGAGYTDPSNLGISSIKVFLEWDADENRFPKNMKFTFESQSFNPFEFKKSGKNPVKIWKKDTKTKNSKNTFKVENLGDKWYLVRSN